MAINYNERLRKLQERKFDSVLNESLTAKNFSSKELPENVKYLLESMRPIGKKYNERNIEALENVKTHLERDLDLHFDRAYERQGSIETNTNIKIHSDADLLTIIDRYHFLSPKLENLSPYTASDPDEDIKELRRQALKILKNKYSNVDDSNEKCISIKNLHLNQKVDVVFAYWYHTEEYHKTNDKYYKGVKIKSRYASPDFPFAHIKQVNDKGHNTLDGSRKGIRLLKTLRADLDKQPDFVKSFQLTTIVHSVENKKLYYETGREIDIAQAISDELYQIIVDPKYRNSIQSPNGCETPLTDNRIVSELKLLKDDLDELIVDVRREMNTGFVVKNAVRLYN